MSDICNIPHPHYENVRCTFPVGHTCNHTHESEDKRFVSSWLKTDERVEALRSQLAAQQAQITQLEQENEKLKARYSMTLHTDDSLIDENCTLRESVGALQQDRDRYKRAIEDAPHSLHCDRIEKNFLEWVECNCWKSQALKGGE